MPSSGGDGRTQFARSSPRPWRCDVLTMVAGVPQRETDHVARDDSRADQKGVTTVDYDTEDVIAENLSEQMMAEENPEVVADDPVALKIKRSD